MGFSFRLFLLEMGNFLITCLESDGLLFDKLPRKREGQIIHKLTGAFLPLVTWLHSSNSKNG